MACCYLSSSSSALALGWTWWCPSSGWSPTFQRKRIIIIILRMLTCNLVSKQEQDQFCVHHQTHHTQPSWWWWVTILGIVIHHTKVGRWFSVTKTSPSTMLDGTIRARYRQTADRNPPDNGHSCILAILHSCIFWSSDQSCIFWSWPWGQKCQLF